MLATAPSGLGPVKTPAIRYYGAKFRFANRIVQHFVPHVHYVEPFGGAAGVLLRKQPSPLETYNDMDLRVVNFFRVIRNQPQELMDALWSTPYARYEFETAEDEVGTDDPVEAARRYFVAGWQGFGGASCLKSTGWKKQKRLWLNSRANLGADWIRAIDGILTIAERFRKVQIENDCALKVIQEYDSPETLFYIDPPYPGNTRNRRWFNRAYHFDFTDADHVHLINLLKTVKGKVILSTYPNPMYSDALADWTRKDYTTQTMNRASAVEWLFLSSNLTTNSVIPQIP